MMISSLEGFINQQDHYSKDNAGTSKSKYTLLYYGELSYNHGNSKTKKYGSIYALKEEAALIPFVYHSFKIKNNNPFYFARYLNLSMHDRYLVKVISSGARMDGLLNISSADFYRMPIKYPSLKEQNYIEDFFDKIDKKLVFLKAKIEVLKKYRKGLLKIVCEQGHVCILGEVLREEIHKSKVNNEYPIISSTSEGVFLQKDYFNHQVASDNNVGYKIIRKNQIVFSPQNLWLGNINLNDKYDVGCVSPSYKIYSYDTELIDPQFFIEYLKTPYMLYQYKLCSEQGASVVRRNLDLSSFLELKITLPNLEKQKIIGALKTHLDLLDRQLFLLRQIKSYLLQNMFI